VFVPKGKDISRLVQLIKEKWTKSAMKSKPIKRRDFIKSAAIATGAVIIAACAPSSVLPTLGDNPIEGQTNEAPSSTESQGTTMKTLIVYDTLYGNTEKIAQSIKAAFGSQNDVKYIKAADARVKDIEKIDLILVGSPTHGGQFTEPVKNFIDSIPEKGLTNIKAAAFDTSFDKKNQGVFLKAIVGFFGYASPRITKALMDKGAKVVGEETFFVVGKEGPLKEGEVERARAWAEGIIKTAKA
jgi:flavodoxin